MPNLLLLRIVFALLCTVGFATAENVAPRPTPSVVYIAHDAGAIHHYRADSVVVRSMVDRLLLAVTGQSDIAKAWGSLVSPKDRVGIKISAAGGELFATHRPIVDAIADGLAAAGVPRSSIVVWDRSVRGALEAGYESRGNRYQLLSTSPRDGYDPKAIFSAPIMGNLIWGDLEYKSNGGQTPLLSDTENTSNESHFSRILSSNVTKVINVPVMSDSATNGVAGCLYNMTIPNIDNWRRFNQSAGGRAAFGASGLVEMYADPMITNKVVLNIMDGLIAQYAGGPQAAPNFAIHFATLFASKDPVAIDTLALRQLEQWRRNAKLPPIGEIAAHVEIAGKAGLGNADPERIEVRKVGH